MAKRKKATRLRGSKTHGWGSMKKHRGAGNRGGRGNAGTGKRADTRKPSVLGTKYFGKKGFKRANKKIINGLNISYIEEKYTALFNKGFIKEEAGFSIIDLKDLNADKLLGGGKASRKYKIKAESATKKAVEKLRLSGSELITTEENRGDEKSQQVKGEENPAEEKQAVDDNKAPTKQK